MKRIPLYAKDGTRVAWAIVDDDDYDRLRSHVWRRSTKGYVIRNRTIRMSREVLRMKPGDGLEADHKNHNPLDNRKRNLRKVTHAQNMQNAVRTRGNNGSTKSSKHRGVYKTKSSRRKRWMAYINLGGKMYNLGYYLTEDEAAQVASEARREHMPFAIEA